MMVTLLNVRSRFAANGPLRHSAVGISWIFTANVMINKIPPSVLFHTSGTNVLPRVGLIRDISERLLPAAPEFRKCLGDAAWVDNRNAWFAQTCHGE